MSPSTKARSACGQPSENSGFLFPYDKRVTINLAPADVRKGSLFDLPIVVGLLVATGQLLVVS